MSTWREPKPSDSCFDLLHCVHKQIKELRKEHKVSIAWEHVKGHQDDDNNAPLDEWARMNISCDEAAKAYLAANKHRHCPNHKFSRESMTMYFRGKKLSSFDMKELYKDIYGEQIKAYWKRKHDISDEADSLINWTITGKAYRSLPFGKQRWLSKHATGFCAVGRMELL